MTHGTMFSRLGHKPERCSEGLRGIFERLAAAVNILIVCFFCALFNGGINFCLSCRESAYWLHSPKVAGVGGASKKPNDGRAVHREINDWGASYLLPFRVFFGKLIKNEREDTPLIGGSILLTKWSARASSFVRKTKI